MEKGNGPELWLSAQEGALFGLGVKKEWAGCCWAEGSASGPEAWAGLGTGAAQERGCGRRRGWRHCQPAELTPELDGDGRGLGTKAAVREARGGREGSDGSSGWPGQRLSGAAGVHPTAAAQEQRGEHGRVAEKSN